MKQGFVLPLILLLLTSLLVYYVAVRFSRIPNIQTQETAKSIYQYPNAKNWQIQNHKNVCILPTTKCSQPTLVTFETANSWQFIYTWYKSAMIQFGWFTNSQIYTSLPSSIVFTNNNNCEANLSPDSKSMLDFLNRKNRSDLNAFKFTVTCQLTN